MSPDRKESDGWLEWQNHVLSELTDLKKGNYHITEKLSRIEIELAVLKLKASLWGGLSGLGAAVGVIILKLLFKD